jgi:hypothetical protein
MMRTCAPIHSRTQIIYLIGWSPDASQPKPLRRGSATKHLRDLDAELAAMPDSSPADSSPSAQQMPLEPPAAAAADVAGAEAKR